MEKLLRDQKTLFIVGAIGVVGIVVTVILIMILGALTSRNVPQVTAVVGPKMAFLASTEAAITYPGDDTVIVKEGEQSTSIKVVYAELSKSVEEISNEYIDSQVGLTETKDLETMEVNQFPATLTELVFGEGYTLSIMIVAYPDRVIYVETTGTLADNRANLIDLAESFRLQP